MRVHTVALIILLSWFSFAHGQSDIEEIEKIFRDEGALSTSSEDSPVRNPEVNVPNKDLDTVRNLEPFQNYVAIQRRFLPKSQRFELFGALGAMVNDPFFSNYSAQGRFGYSFTEAWAFEAMGVYASGAEKKVTEDLRRKRGVTTDNLLTPRYFYGGAVKWSPFYGKMGWLNSSILAFDHYFTVGGGMTQTNQNTSPFSYLVGTGQVYAITKSVAFRWDLLWLIYNTESRTGGPTQFGLYNNVFLTAGFSFFFPEAGYR